MIVYVGHRFIEHAVDERIQVFIPGVVGCVIPIGGVVRPGCPGGDATLQEDAGCPKVADIIGRIWLRRKDTPLAVRRVLGFRGGCKCIGNARVADFNPFISSVFFAEPITNAGIVVVVHIAKVFFAQFRSIPINRRGVVKGRNSVAEMGFNNTVKLMVNVGDGHVIGVLDEVIQVFIPGVLGSLDPIRRNERPGLPCRSATHEVAGRALNPKVADVIRWIRR